jgi:Ca-activated chloride channel family protein
MAQPAEGKKKPEIRRASSWTPAPATPPEPAEIDEPVSPGIDRVDVPGGLAAAFAVARLEGVPTEGDFFLRYCRAVAAGRTSLRDWLVAYFEAAAELSALAAQGGSGTVNLSLGAEAARETTVRALALFGWNVTEVGGALVHAGLDGRGIRERYRIEPGDQSADGVRQEIPAALGIEAVAMVSALVDGGTFPAAIPSGKADFLQARLWTKLAGGLPPGGFAELFARKPRLARVYAGLAAMGPDAAAAVISGVGLRALVDKYANVIAFYGESFSVSGGRAAVPGGPEAEPIWEKLAGAAPRDPKAFFRALVQKDQGRLAAFHYAVWRGDAVRQRFFTRTAARAERIYKWYRDSEELRAETLITRTDHWRRDLFRELPVDGTGALRFPGGRAAWKAPAGTDDAALLEQAWIEALVAVAKVEEVRKMPLDGGSASLLAAHYGSWRELFPYFEKLPGLGRVEFEALASFEKSVSARPAAAREATLAEWHSLVKLIELAAGAGSLDPAAAARAFRHACEAAAAPDHSLQAVKALREMAGGAANLDEAVPGRLLALSATRRAAYDRVMELQHTPKLASVGQGRDRSQRTRSALGGMVYADLLEPDSLVVAEDPTLLARQRFVDATFRCKLFCSSRPTLDTGKVAFLGGFANFEESARLIAREKIRIAARLGPAAAGSARAGSNADFQATARLVEVYATVTVGNGEYADGLSRADFAVFDNGEPAPVAAFDSNAAGVSVALLLDASGSMTGALSTVRKSAFALAGNLRPADSVAVYSFGNSVSELQAWTADKDAAKRAILGVRLQDATELHDALVRVIHEMSERNGKKAIVVFTDGHDTASALNAEAVVRRARETGIPVYTIAHGEALTHPGFLNHLEKIAASTGGWAFAIRERSEIAPAFKRISEDLSHGYLLAFRPDEDPQRAWHRIQVRVRGKDRRVRAREGYYPE